MKKLFAIAATCASIALISGCGQVDTGEAGFFTRWGEITSKEPLAEGLHCYEPIGTDLITYSIKNQTMTIKTDVFTKDVQQMKIELSVTYNLMKNKVIELHANTGRQYAQVLIVPCCLGAAKDALGKMEADAIVGNREIATAAIQSAIKEKLSPYGINVSLVNIANIDYSDEYEKAIEEKQVALQRSIKERNETARVKEMAQQDVVRAEAEAKATVAKAIAEAEAKMKVAEAEARAIELKNKALAQSKALIEYETVKTWDGKLPVQMLGSTPVPFLKLEEKRQ
jgi:regulator of protease activity HflC (stomatin/prohibitin superfamily)